MRVSFLAGETPATKSFSRDASGAIQVQSYPNIYSFNSYTHDVDTIEEFHAALQSHAERYHCLLKGKLTAELRNQSRQGSTNTTDTTEFFVGDIDGVADIDSVEDFIQRCMPPEFQNVDYIVQLSSSYGVLPAKGLSAHFFMLLDRETPAPLLKVLLSHINLTSPALKNSIRLNSTGTSINWPLDRTVCQNDKLIYIAPPLCHDGIVDTAANDRIRLVKKARRKVTLDLSTLSEALNREREAIIVNELRSAVGLKRKQSRYKFVGDVQICTNPDTATLSAAPKIERGFVYLSLNGGKTYPFWYPQQNPEILYNWKGEPPVLLKDFLPDYWQSIAAEYKQGPKHDDHYLVFRDFQTDQYFNGTYDAATDTLSIARASSKDRLEDFLAQHDQPMPKSIPDWEYTFRPADLTLIDVQNKRLNKFVASPYLKNPTPNQTEIPPIIKRVLWSVVGNDRACAEHFVNWLAALVQKRTKIGTAWVLHGVEGTGKGVLFHKILKPILGSNQCAIRQLQDFEDQFNDYLETCLLLFVDEATITETKNSKKTISFLKNLITEKTGKIRRMFMGPQDVEMYANIIFASNNYDALHISPTDRRFNIAPRQEQAIRISQQEIDSIEAELADFTGYLLQYEVDVVKAKTPLENQARIDMQKASMSSPEQFAHAIRTGDLEFFAQYLNTPPPIGVAHLHGEYKRIIGKWAADVGTADAKVTRDDLMIVFCYLQNAQNISPNKFSRLLAHLNIVTVRFRIGDTRQWGVTTTWKAEAEDVAVWTGNNILQFQRVG